MALAVAEIQTAADATSASFTFTLAAGSALGDLLVAFFANDFDTLATLQTPTGTAASVWTLQDSFDGGSNKSHIKTFTAPVTTAGAQTAIFTSSVSNDEHAAILWRIPGAAFDVAGHNNGVAAAAHVAPSLTPAGVDDIYCCIWTGNDGGGGVYNYTYPSSPFVGRTEIDVQTFATFGWGHEPITSGAATGTRTATASVATHAWCSAAVLVKASAGAAAAPYVPRRLGPNYRR